uniref:RWP-RK domain-containing protein n=1 Tax=Globisporangium ultimum (strain ATCC 200006 / CBS 805.95 / DAOM BR144) TaxID=431595 RepID=K3WX46_GLOUD
MVPTTLPTCPSSPMQVSHSPMQQPSSPHASETSPVTSANNTPVPSGSHAIADATTGQDIPFEFHFDFQSPVAHQRPHHAPFMLATPSSKKHSSLALPISCTFEALSHHFHLPLKVAAEKFGVRATAFKKRCRAIGIRHWPYRKVRSVKRSLLELAKFKEEGALSDKQNIQLAGFEKELDRLLSPETYGIDPASGRLFARFDDDDDCDSEDDDDCDSCGSQSSSRVSSPYSKSPTKSKYKPRARSAPRVKNTMVSNQAQFFYNMVGHEQMNPSSMSETATMPSVSIRFASHPSLNHASSGIPFEAYDPFFGDFKSEYTLTMEDFGDEDHPSCGYTLEGVPSHEDDFFPLLRSPTMAARRSQLSTTASTSIEGSRAQNESENLEDDVFLHISPDFGCLV